MKKNIFLFIALTSGYVTAMEETKTHLLVIPGQNGMGGQNVDKVLPYFARNNLRHFIPTPLQKPDFGQTNCLTFLSDEIGLLKYYSTIKDNDHIILHGSSQGTATTINYAAHNPDNIKALILESVMLTGNSAIFHTVDNMMIPEQCDLPESSYYTLPYVAKSSFPNYAPTGEQPINNIDNLPTDLPIIILHDTKDFQLSFKDAQALYAYLTEVKHNNNVYLFAQESPKGKHINLLTIDDMEEICAIETILRLHNLLPFNHNQIVVDLKKYQPAVQQEWLDHFEAMHNKEQNLECVDSSLKTTGISAALYAAGKWLGIV